MKTLSGQTEAPASRTAAGFTMVELLVVMGIIAMMAALTVGVVKTLTEGAKQDSAEMLLQKVESALERYEQQVGKYPSEIPTADWIRSRYTDDSQFSESELNEIAQQLRLANLQIASILVKMDEFSTEGGTHARELVKDPNTGDFLLVDPWYEGTQGLAHEIVQVDLDGDGTTDGPGLGYRFLNVVRGGHNSPGLDIWCNGENGINDELNNYNPENPENYGDDIVNWARR